MGLRPCTTCDGQVAESARTCPHCGARLPPMTWPWSPGNPGPSSIADLKNLSPEQKRIFILSMFLLVVVGLAVTISLGLAGFNPLKPFGIETP